MFNLKKLSAIGASTLMVGLTMGTAYAANYPAPFVSGGSADVAIVYGSVASSLDLVGASNIQANLQSFLGGSSGGTVTTTSGETVSLDTSADRIWLNTSLNSIKSTLTKSDLPTVLADQSFDGDVTADVTPTIKLQAGANAGGTNSGKVIFAKQPKSSDDPQVGISLGTSESSNPLYNASVTFSKAIAFNSTDSEGETINLFGKEFVVSTDTDGTDLVLFSSAQSVTLTKTSGDNPTATVDVNGQSYTVELANGDSTSATVVVNGVSKTINEGDSRKVGGIDIAVKDVTSSDVAGITATLLVGSQKITFTSGATVTKGSDNDPVDGTTAYIVGGPSAATELAVTVFRPDSSNDAILPGDTFTDPVFGSFQVDFAGLNSPLDDSSREKVSVLNSGDDTMSLTFSDSDGNDGTFDFAHNQSSAWTLADDTNNPIYVYEDANLTEDDYVVVGTEDYGHLLQVTQIYNNTGTSYGDDRVKFQDVMSGTTYDTVFTSEGTGHVTIDGKQYTVTFTGSGDGGSARVTYPSGEGDGSHTAGEIVLYPSIETSKGGQVILYQPLNLSLANISGSGNQVSRFDFPDGDGYTGFAVAYAGSNATTADWTVNGVTFNTSTSGAPGTTVTVGQLVYNFTAGGLNYTKVYVVDPEGNANIDQPGVIFLEGKDDNSQYHAVVVDLETTPAGNSDNGVGVNDVLFSSDYYHASASLQSDSDITKDIDWWGTVVTTDASESDQKTVEISYPGSQTYAQIYVGETGSTVTSSGSASSSLGDVLVTDAEISSVQSKNLIVVGGSCVNTVASSLLGGVGCGASFTDATGVGTGQFLIESMTSTYNSGKIALVVAGYEAADTGNAATYLRTQTVDTSVGKKYVGTTATSAELVVE